MVNLIPFNKRNTDLFGTSFENFQDMLDDFFTESRPFGRSLAWDTFKIDLQDNDKEYIVEAELPGVRKDELSVRLEDGRLKISFNKEENIEENKKNYIHKERRYSSMSRNVYLADADSDGIKAKLEDGVLKIRVPKKAKPDHSVSIDIE